MAVEHRVVSYLNFVIEIDELLHVLELVLHVISLTDIADDTSVESLNQELKSANSKGISWLQIMVLSVK